MRVGIVGGGHTGLVHAGYLAHHNNAVSVLTSKPEKWSGELYIHDLVAGQSYYSKLDWVGNDPAVFMNKVDVVMVTLPAFVLASFVNEVAPYTDERHIFILSPGSGGREYAFGKLLKKGAVVAGMQRVVFISRAKEYGKEGILSGTKPKLVVSALPKRFNGKAKETLEALFQIPVDAKEYYLPIALGSSNPILHTARLRTMFAGYDGSQSWPENIAFYQQWDDAASELFFKMDSELQKVAQSYKEIGGAEIIPLTEYYESQTIGDLTKKISGIPAFKGITSPMVKTESGYKPDFDSRYFTEDFCFGLKQIYDLGILAGLTLPHIEQTLNWARGFISPQARCLELSEHGICSQKDVLEFYHSDPR